MSLRLPVGWIKQIDRTAHTTGTSRPTVARALIGAALASRQVETVVANQITEIDLETARVFIALWTTPELCREAETYSSDGVSKASFTLLLTTVSVAI